MSEPDTRELYWYVLVAFLVAVGIGVGLFLALVGLTNRLTVIGVGTLVIIVVLGLASFATFPALYRDSQYLRDAGKWDPRWVVYVAGGAGTPILGYLTGGFLLGPRVNLFLSTLSWFGSVTAMCAVYLYRRRRAVGVP
mgnify:CR=1 FL=1